MSEFVVRGEKIDSTNLDHWGPFDRLVFGSVYVILAWTIVIRMVGSLFAFCILHTPYSRGPVPV